MTSSQTVNDDQSDSYFFGKYFIAPLVAKVFVQITNIAKNNSAEMVVFPSREGWYLQKHWDSCRNFGFQGFQIGSSYVYANRRIANRTYRFFSEQKRFEVCTQHYSGYVGNFLWARLGISETESVRVLNDLGITSSDRIDLPKDSAVASYILESLYKDEVVHSQLVHSRNNYVRYLSEAMTTGTNIFCDIGYSGTVVEALSEVSGFDIIPVFFQEHISKLKIPYVNPRGHSITSVIAPPAIPGSSQDIGRLAQLLEAVFRAPEAGLIEIDDNSEPVFDGFNEISSFTDSLLQSIHRGVSSGLKTLLEDSNYISTIELACEALLSSYRHGTALSFRHIEALVVEDAYSGGKHIRIK